MNPVDPDALIIVGKVAQAHGVTGEIKVVPETADLDQFSGFEVVHLGMEPTSVRSFRVRGARIQPGARGPVVLLRIAGIDDRESAEKLKKQWVYAHQDDVSLDEDEVFLHDMIGLEVFTTEGERVGRVHDILELPAQHVYVVARDGRPDVMIPAVPAFVTEIDLDGGRITVAPISGLLDDDAEEVRE
jgi:16S rRNA processing protein RimM